MSKMTVDEFEKAFEDAVADNKFCAVGKLIATHEFGPQIGAKIKDEVHYSNRVISSVMKKMGVVISAELIGKHRTGICRCQK